MPYMLPTQMHPPNIFISARLYGLFGFTMRFNALQDSANRNALHVPRGSENGCN